MQGAPHHLLQQHSEEAGKLQSICCSMQTGCHGFNTAEHLNSSSELHSLVCHSAALSLLTPTFAHVALCDALWSNVENFASV